MSWYISQDCEVPFGDTTSYWIAYWVSKYLLYQNKLEKKKKRSEPFEAVGDERRRWAADKQA